MTKIQNVLLSVLISIAIGNATYVIGSVPNTNTYSLIFGAISALAFIAYCVYGIISNNEQLKSK